jgi:hypothetical protein
VLPLVGPDATSTFRGRLDPHGALLASTTRRHDGSVTVTVGVDLPAVASSGDGPWRLVLHGEFDAGPVDVRVPAPRDEVVGRFWRRGRPYRVIADKAAVSRGFAVRTEPLTLSQVGSAALRRLRR